MKFILKANVRQNRSENLSYYGIVPDDLVMLSNLSTCLPNMTDRLLEHNESRHEITCITIKTPSMLCTAIFHGCKNDYFQMKNCDISLIFA